ncbi:MAG TPA: hypothetical protein VLL25_00920 [Acidimicrobiales bacterium]|nr:hypothetical protein [Acidimicrobiales bacterium]
MAEDTWTVLSPVAERPRTQASGNVRTLGRPISGLRVGLEVDYAWISYFTVIDEWERLLRADGAEPDTFWVERSRDDTAKRAETDLRADLDEWSRLIDCGVVGLGN